MMYVLFLFSNDRAVRIPLPIYIRSDAGLFSLRYIRSGQAPPYAQRTTTCAVLPMRTT